MLVTPVQQTPLPFDPARQQLTPPVAIVVPNQTNPAEIQVQPGQTAQDQFNPQDNSRSRGQKGTGQSSQNDQDLSNQLRSAWQQLEQLKQQAAEALVAGNASAAKQAAQEAADVAISIQNLTGGQPGVDVGGIEDQANELAKSNGDSGPGTGFDPGQTASPEPTAIEIAFAGLSTANAVVDTAASIPYHPAEDRTAINGYKQTVLDALQNIEALAGQQSGSLSNAVTGGALVDIKA